MKINKPGEKELALIREYLYIDSSSQTGIRWRKSSGPQGREGAEAMTAVTKNGYYSGRFLGTFYLAHRVVFFLDRGYWPDGIIDHIDGDKLNNIPVNLRDVSQSENGANMKARGYYWNGEKNCWRAVVKCEGRVYSKHASSEKEAREWYESKKLELYPQLNGSFYWNS